MIKFVKILFAAGFIFSLTSCLKDKNFDEGTTGHDLSTVPKIIELGEINSPKHDKSVALDFVDKSSTLNFLTVRLAAEEVATEDIKVTLDTSGMNAALAAYNTTTGKSIQRLPNAFFSFPDGLTVTILKGTREAYLKVTTNAIKFNPSLTYGLAFKLGSVDKPGYILSQNFGNWVTTIGAKNPYDGIYSLDFKNYHPSLNAGYTGGVVEVHLITTGPNTVKIFWPTADAFANPALLGGALNYFGAQEPEYTINTTTNVVTVQNAAAGAVTFYTMNPTYNSYYDPAAKKLYAKFGYNYVGGTFSAATSREWTQVFTYLRAR